MTDPEQSKRIAPWPTIVTVGLIGLISVVVGLTVIWGIGRTITHLWSSDLIESEQVSPRLGEGRSRSDDEAVIETALLAIYDKTWRSMEWLEPGDFIVIHPDWATKHPTQQPWTPEGRPDFSRALDHLIFSEDLRDGVIKREKGYVMVGKANANRLRQIRAAIASRSPQRKASPPISIRDLTLDNRIVVSNEESVWFRRQPVKNRDGVEGSIRIAAKLEPPCYSSNGQFAMLTIYCPGFHMTEVFFLLERNDAGWRIMFFETSDGEFAMFP